MRVTFIQLNQLNVFTSKGRTSMYYPPNQPSQYPPQPEQYQRSSGWQQPSYPSQPEQYQQPPEWQSRQSYPYQQPQYTPPPPTAQPPAPKKKSHKKLFAF